VGVPDLQHSGVDASLLEKGRGGGAACVEKGGKGRVGENHD
jgi:hypothetical protein